jgi:hypothetical protein
LTLTALSSATSPVADEGVAAEPTAKVTRAASLRPQPKS